MNDKTGGPAFPRQYSKDDAFGRTYEHEAQEGMTLRDYFAAKAMQAVLTGYQKSAREVAKEAYMMADAMLKAREQ